MRESLIAAEIRSFPNRKSEAASALQRLGFRILHIGPTISVEGPPSLWTAIFNVTFEPRTKRVMEEVEGGEVTYQGALTQQMRIPLELNGLVADIMFVEPPEFYSALE